MSTASNHNTAILRGESRVTIRSIQVTDVLLERDFIMALSPESRRFRFLDSIAIPSKQLLEGLTNLDRSTEAAFIALATVDGVEREIGVARMSAVSVDRAEFAVAVSDAWQRKGIGSLLTSRVIEAARARGIGTLFSIDASQNRPMQQFATRLGFSRKQSRDEPTEVLHTLEITPRTSDR